MTSARRRRAWLAGALAGVATLALAGVAAARPGGGDSFSGGGGHGGSRGSSGGGGDMFGLIFMLFRMLLYYPSIGLPVLVILVGYGAYCALRYSRNGNWDSGRPAGVPPTADLSDVRKLDPAFSQPVFEDFAFRLFSTAQRARHSAEALATVAPYVAEAARTDLATRAPAGERIAQVVVGALRSARVDVPAAAPGAAGRSGRVRVTVEYEANLATAAHTYYTVEHWVFSRDAAVQSKPPGVARSFPCPNCGAPWQASRTGTQVCASCGQAVDNGRFDWVVERAHLFSSDERPPTLTTEVPERGTDVPTYRQPDLSSAWGELVRDDPEVTTEALDTRLAMIYSQLNTAWANNDLRPVRGLVSDGLYDYLSYWVDAYREQGLRNALTDMRITRTVIAKLVRDRYYDALTVRLWATGKDYVIREPGGELVRGSARRERPYSEYWTLIRAAGRRGAPRTALVCSNCGAPLSINQSGECEHCGAHLTGGEFDWVVSKIEQDDTYRG